MTAETAAWMQKRLTEMQHELQQSEADLAALREGAVPSSGGGMHGNDGTGEGIAARLAAVRRVLAAHVGTYEQIDAAAARDASLQGIREIQNDPGVSSAQEAFAAAQQQVAEIGKRYGPQHPTMIAAMSERDRAKTHLDESRRTIAEQIRAEYESALAEERALVAAATRGADRRTGLSQEPTELDALEHAVEINRELYDLFYKRVSETAVASEPVTAHARVIEPALAPIVPSRPRAGITIAGTFLGALLLGAVVAFVGDSLNNTLRSPQDVGAKLGQSLLAMVPPISVRKLGRVRGGIIEDAAYAEAMHTLRLSILTGTSRRPQKVVLVTSALAGEGKSTIALNLAAELAKTGKVLIIDGDMRRPAIGRLLDLPRYDAGLSELITRTAPFKACLAKTKVANLHVIRTGFIPDDPQELLAHRRLAKILRVLTQAYTHIVIDSPPVLSVPDAAVLSKYADAVVLVTLAHSTPVPQIESGLHQLERVDAPVAGVVLNGLDRRKAARYAAAYRDREERRA